MLKPEEKEGPLIERSLMMLGIPKSDFLIEGESKNTHENAVFTKAFLDEEKVNGQLLLITAAFHMRRSLACFTKMGIRAEPYSTDRYAGPRKFDLEYFRSLPRQFKSGPGNSYSS